MRHGMDYEDLACNTSVSTVDWWGLCATPGLYYVSSFAGDLVQIFSNAEIPRLWSLIRED